jgi:hypothetical protein
MLQKFQHHLQLFSLLAPGLLTAVGVVVANGILDLLYLVPLVSTALALRYIWEEQVINRIGDYLLDMETSTIPELIGVRCPETIPAADRDSGDYWVAWERYFHERFPTPYAAMTSVLTFVAMPIGPPIVLGTLVAVQRLAGASDRIHTILPIGVHVFFTLGYILVAVVLTLRLLGLGPTELQRRIYRHGAKHRPDAVQ